MADFPSPAATQSAEPAKSRYGASKGNGTHLTKFLYTRAPSISVILPTASGGNEQHHKQNDRAIPYAARQNLQTPARANLYQDDDEVSLAGSVIRSEKSTSDGTKCNQCKKSSAKRYDPLIKCLTCIRHFHDGCRKPPLAQGIDRLVVLVTGFPLLYTVNLTTTRATWRCYRCVLKKRVSLAIPNNGHLGVVKQQPCTTAIVEPKTYEQDPEVHSQLAERSATRTLSLVAPLDPQRAKHANIESVTCNLNVARSESWASDPNDKAHFLDKDIRTSLTPSEPGISSDDTVPDNATFIASGGEAQVDQSTGGSIDSEVTPKRLKPALNVKTDISRLAIPDTSDHCAVKLATDGKDTTIVSSNERFSSSTDHDSPLSVEEARIKKKSPTVLCGTCKTRRVQAKKGDDNPLW